MKKNKDGSYVIQGTIKFFNGKTGENEEYSTDMKERILELSNELDDARKIGELDHDPNSSVVDGLRASHTWNNMRFNDDGELLVDITPLNVRPGTQGFVLKTLIEQGFEFRPMIRATAIHKDEGIEIDKLFAVDLTSVIKNKK